MGEGGGSKSGGGLVQWDSERKMFGGFENDANGKRDLENHLGEINCAIVESLN